MPQINNKEERHMIVDAEFRAKTDETGKRFIEGYAAIFDSPTSMGWYMEVIRSSAFTKTITEADVRCLFNHDPNFVLGRNKSGTLTLTVDEKGLKYRAELPDTQAARDLYTSIERGDVNQCSFAFRKIKDNWYTDTFKGNDGLDYTRDVRELLEVQLFDVSPVTYPAYQDTSVSARSLWETRGIDIEALTVVLNRAERKMEITAEQRELVKKAIETLTGLTVSEPGQPHSDHRSEPDQPDNAPDATLLAARLAIMARDIDA